MQTINIKKLLVPMAYSQTSLNALDLAIAMSLRHDAEIRLLHVLNSFQDGYVWVDSNLLPDSNESPAEKAILKLQKLAETILSTHPIHCSIE